MLTSQHNPQRLIDIASIMLRDNSWALEDPKFCNAICLMRSFLDYTSSDEECVHYFLKNLTEHDFKLIRDRVNVIRIKKYRPEVYEKWQTKT